MPVRAYDRCWILGDSFASCSFEQHFKARKSIEYNGYIKANFDISGFFCNFMNDNPSVIARMGNLMYVAMDCRFSGKLLPLPKLVVVVPDDDLIRLVSTEDYIHDFSEPQSRILNYIMTQHQRSISIFKENLPARCVRSDFPKILWIQAPLHNGFHNNSLRKKFNRCLEDVVKIDPNTHTLFLKRVWEPADSRLYISDSCRFTAEGYKVYWEAIDRTIRYFDSVILQKQNVSALRKTQKFTKLSQKDSNDQNDRFRWCNPKFNSDDDSNIPTFRVLPTLPRKQHKF